MSLIDVENLTLQFRTDEGLITDLRAHADYGSDQSWVRYV